VKRHTRISSLTLELYYRGLATRKERRLVEKALKTDIKVQNRYKALEESEREFRNLFAEELSRLNIKEIPNTSVKRPIKKAVVITAIAAVLLCVFVPVFFYLKGKAPNKENAIAAVSETETTEGFLIEDNEEIEGLELTSYDENRFNFEKKTETAVKSGGVTVAAVPETDTEVRTRGGNTVQSVLPIPPGLTSIFENMFADKQLTAVVIPNRITSIAKNAFADNPLVSVTIGANVDVHDEAIPGNFARAYNSYGKAAGVYTRTDVNSGEWGRGE
jgi:hypothetical protein